MNKFFKPMSISYKSPIAVAVGAVVGVAVAAPKIISAVNGVKTLAEQFQYEEEED